MDHMEWLGNDLADIAVEKAGIARQGRPLIIGDTDVPQSLFDAARDIGAEVMQPGQNIATNQTGDSWAYRFGRHQYGELPLPGIAGAHQLKNAAAAICAVNCLESRLPVKEGIIKSAIANTRLVGRFEKVSEQPSIYLDVGHNPAASSALREILGSLSVKGSVIGVIALQKNREIEPFIQPLVDVISIWHVANMANGMGHEVANLAGSIIKMNPEAQVREHLKVVDALDHAQRDAGEYDCIMVFGSFYTVSEARAALHV
jgi:dihydrofolate synthase/folylpolyglutamate synthase